MATSMDLFRKLGAGLKFDFQRFRSDAEKFQVIKTTSRKVTKQEVEKALDVFGSANSLPKSSKDGHVFSVPASAQSVKGKKRRLKDEHFTSKKRKRKEGCEDKEKAGTSEDGGGLQLMSSLHPKMKKDENNKEHSAENLEQRRREEVNAFRKQHKIHVWGTDIPDPVGTFHELQNEYNLHPDIIENIHRAGFVQPTQIQTQAIPVMLHRRELLACAPTGSGKTAAFILPVLAHLKEPKKKGFRAVVVSPTRELANQTYREFQRLAEGRGLRIHLIESTTKAIKKFGPDSSQKFDILVTTPNRLVFLLNQEPPGIKLNNVEWLIVDESDKLFEEGKKGFRDQLATIYQACDSTHVRRTMFSATFTHDVEQWCKLNLDNVVTVTVGQKNTATELIQQELVFVGGEYGKLLAVREIFRKGFHPPVLVFLQSKDRAKELFQELIYDGYNVDVIHSDKTQTQRDNIVKSFRSGKIWVLIATELMGRGIDFKGINLVINYDFPTSAISYIHRIGRTGRAGRTGKAVTFFTEDDAVYLRSIANVMRNAGCPVPEYMLQLKKLTKGKQKKLERHPVKRDTIRTLPKQDLDKAKRKREIIQKILKKKQKKSQSGKGLKVTAKEHETMSHGPIPKDHKPKPVMTGEKKQKTNKGSKVAAKDHGTTNHGPKDHEPTPVMTGEKKQKTNKGSKVKVQGAATRGKKSQSRELKGILSGKQKTKVVTIERRKKQKRNTTV